MNPPDTTIPEAREAAAALIAKTPYTIDVAARVMSDACLSFHHRKLEECGDAEEVATYLCDGWEDYRFTDIVKIIQLHTAKEVEKATAAKKAEVEMLRGIDCEADEDGPCGCCIKCYKNQIATLQKQCEELRRDLNNHCACEHDGRGELTSECQEHEDLRTRAEKAEAEVVDYKNANQIRSKELSQLQRDVKPLVTCLKIMAGGKNGEEPGAAMLSEVALETFLLKHPELSQS